MPFDHAATARLVATATAIATQLTTDADVRGDLATHLRSLGTTVEQAVAASGTTGCRPPA